MKSHAFIDESARRGRDYYLVAAVVTHGDVDSLRRLSRSFLHAWPATMAFRERAGEPTAADLGDPGRDEQVQVGIASGSGRDALVRAEGLSRIAGMLLVSEVTRLLIESREGRDHLDGRS